MTKKPFSGFPARAEVTPIPNLFFTVVMPKIDGVAELKTILHVFWLLSRRRGYPQFVTYNELLSDPVLISGIGEGTKPKDEVLRLALEQAVEHGTMLHLRLDRDGQPEDVYFINSEAAKEAISKIQQGDFPQLVLAHRKGEVAEATPPDIFSLYEQNIGMLTPMIAEELQEAEKLYPADWIESAFKEAVSLNKRSWKYIARILERWAVEGKDDGKPRRDFKKEDDREKYVRGKYGHMVKR
ncbi:MAG: DnaD domain protein [Chloroflexi bacterium]|nr:DnaD domain protein [Chloroflexota bacterium]MBL7061401.1 DnaD domain protein [Dehalococcoidia bacterium]